MAFHHVAITTKDLDATHRFYTEAMGFDLVKVEAQPTHARRAGWARHLFYDTGNGEMLAVWDIHDAMLDAAGTRPRSPPGSGCRRGRTTSRSLARPRRPQAAGSKRWLDNGLDCVRIDHGWCTSIYADDPNGITVEFCTSTREFTDDDRAEAQAQLAASKPELNRTEPEIEFFTATANA